MNFHLIFCRTCGFRRQGFAHRHPVSERVSMGKTLHLRAFVCWASSIRIFAWDVANLCTSPCPRAMCPQAPREVARGLGKGLQVVARNLRRRPKILLQMHQQTTEPCKKSNQTKIRFKKKDFLF